MTSVETFVSICFAAISIIGVIFARSEPAKDASQEMVSIPVHVVDSDGKPVARAVVIPWALRCSQGHGPWQLQGFGKSKPPILTTNDHGDVNVQYPRYAIADERVLTTEVTLSIDHPDFAYVSYEGVNIPRQETGPHIASLKRGVAVEIVPLQDGKPASLDGLYAGWSDGRSWKPGVTPTTTADGAIRIPTMPVGKQQVLLVRLDGERATHFSPIVDLDLKNGATVRERIELRPAVRITGRISDNVPRPVKNGRLSAETLRKEILDDNVDWYTWVPIADDGTFVIDAWPAGEVIQIIALCDGYMAESGAPPAVVKNHRTPDPLHRAQVFLPELQTKAIVLRMTPTARCDIKVVDDKGTPIAGAKIGSCPNIHWWNDGSQIYCAPLLRGEKLLIKRDYKACIDEPWGQPFLMTTDHHGRGALELPAGKEDLYADHDRYELSVVRGRRGQRVSLVAGEPNSVRLVLQPKGSEHLGEWDKLAGVLFGCTGEQCRRLLNDPAFREKMAKVGEMLDAADAPNNPAVLFVAYMSTADAFDDLGDAQEAINWRHKAAKEFARLSSDKQQEIGAKK